MEIMVLPDGETYGALEGCSIRRLPDQADAEQIDELLADGGGEVIVSFSDDRRRVRRRPRVEPWPGRVWLAAVHTESESALEVFLSRNGAAACARHDHAAYYSAAAVRPLLEALERHANDAGLDPDLCLGARDALARFRALSGAGRHTGGDG